MLHGSGYWQGSLFDDIKAKTQITRQNEIGKEKSVIFSLKKLKNEYIRTILI